MRFIQTYLTVFLLVASSSAAQAMVINGSFEAGIPITTSTGATAVSGGDIAGWTVSGGNTVDYLQNGAFAGQGFPPGLSALDGNRFIDLTGSDAGFGSISQDILTEAGEVYRLSYWLGGSNLFTQFGDGGNPMIQASVSGSLLSLGIGSRFGANDWSRIDHLFMGLGGIQTLTFAGFQPDLCCYIGLDHVSIAKLPEPGTGLLLLGGLLAVMRQARR